MGGMINSAGFEFCPAISQDGKYFFFTRGADIYWISAKIIEELRPKRRM